MSTDPRASRLSTFRLLGGLQAAQYVPINFFYVALVAILRDNGASLSQVAAINAAGLLLSVKFLWAPLMDKYGSRRRGHFRSWLLVLQSLMVLSLTTLLPLDPVGDYGLLMLVVVLVIQLTAMQDVATDALAVRSLTPEDRSIGSGARHAGGYVGHVLGGGVVLYVYSVWGWNVAIVMLAALTVVPLWQLAFYREAPREYAGARPGFRAVVTIFRQPGVVRWALVLLPLSVVGASCGYALVTPMLVDAGWAPDRIGFVVGILGSLLGIPAAMGAGFLIRRWGRRRLLALSCATQGLALLMYVPLALGHAPFIPTVAVLCVFGCVYAAGTVAVNTIIMDHTRPSSAAGDFTVLTSVGYFVGLGGGALGVAAAEYTGYLPILLGSVGVLLVASVVNASRFSASTQLPEPVAGLPSGSDPEDEPEPEDRRSSVTGA